MAAWLLCALTVCTQTAYAQNPPVCERAVLTLGEAAELLRVDATDLARLAEQKKVPARRVDSSWRFSCGALMDWLKGDSEANSQLTTKEASEVVAAGTAARQAGTTAAPAQEKPVGEAPQERPAEDIFLRGQRVLLGRGEVVVDFGQFYSQSDDHVLASVDGAVGLTTVEQQSFTTTLLGRVGILNETEVFTGTTFTSQDNHQFLGTTNLGSNVRREIGDVSIGVRRTFLRERAGLPDLIATFSGHIPTRDTPYAVSGGLVLVKSVDPVVLFANGNYTHNFIRNFSSATRFVTEHSVDVSMGYGLALNDTLALSMAVSGAFTGDTIIDNTSFRQPRAFSGRFGLTSWLARGLYIEPSVSFGLTGPGRSFAFGVTLPYAF